MRYGFKDIGSVILPLEDSFVRKLSEGGVCRIILTRSHEAPIDKRLNASSNVYMGRIFCNFKHGYSIYI